MSCVLVYPTREVPQGIEKLPKSIVIIKYIRPSRCSIGHSLPPLASLQVSKPPRFRSLQVSYTCL